MKINRFPVPEGMYGTQLVISCRTMHNLIKIVMSYFKIHHAVKSYVMVRTYRWKIAELAIMVTHYDNTAIKTASVYAN